MKKFSYLLTLCLLLYCHIAYTSTDCHRLPVPPGHLLSAKTHTALTLKHPRPSGSCPIWQAFCEGRKRFKDGSIYVGEFKFGKPHGKGKMIWQDGSIYIGEFKNGYRNGWGEFTSPEGDRYEGEWTSDLRQGQGAYSWACGHEYIGSFRADKMEGEGTILFANGESYSGSWKNGLADGTGVFTRADGSRFAGNFLKGQKEGTGMLSWASGDTLKGSWLAGQLDGNCAFLFHNGDRLQTNWDKGDLLEEMTYRTPSGLEVPGSLYAIEDQLKLLSDDLARDFEENMQLSAYSFALEFKAVDRLEEATAFLQLSQDYTPVNSRFNGLIAQQREAIKERKAAIGWAKSNAR